MNSKELFVSYFWTRGRQTGFKDETITVHGEVTRETIEALREYIAKRDGLNLVIITFYRRRDVQ